MLVGASLVALVAVATCVVAWLLWARADERGRAEDDRAAQATVERLQNSIGRVLTSLRTAAGLVDAEGGVDTASFHAWAQAVGSIGATDALALAEIVPADERATFEAARGRRISELSEPGVFRGAPRRATYVPIVAVWPEPGTRGALLGFDLLSEPARRKAIERAESTRRTAFTGTVPFLTGGSGFQAFRAVYAPTQESGRPVGFVSAWFGRRILAGVFRDLPADVRARVGFGGTEIFATSDRPSTGAVRSLELGGRRWFIVARGSDVSHASALAILLGGGVLVLMLALFTAARVTSERRLRSAHEAERAARERSEAPGAERVGAAAARRQPLGRRSADRGRRGGRPLPLRVVRRASRHRRRRPRGRRADVEGREGNTARRMALAAGPVLGVQPDGRCDAARPGRRAPGMGHHPGGVPGTGRVRAAARRRRVAACPAASRGIRRRRCRIRAAARAHPGRAAAARRDRRGARPCARPRRAPRERARGAAPGRVDGAKRGAPRRGVDRRRGRRGDGRRDRIARSGRRLRVGPRRSRASRDPRGVRPPGRDRRPLRRVSARQRWARHGRHERPPARRGRLGRGVRRSLPRAGRGTAAHWRRVARRAAAADRPRRRDRRHLRRRDPPTLGHRGTACPAARDRGADGGGARSRIPPGRRRARCGGGRLPRARRRLARALDDRRAAARDASSTRSRTSERRLRRCTSSHSRKRWRR